ncbi:hypothetical protein SCLCIDRAFT_1220254 [Scleroderma citrinum Foug A]|uniref:Protein kinase domain-containing protein n=1 Tax=Scleroderma citrinum Foug A TaxID=1036808 RepID=A0A0C3DJQ6_9AGAM|nr:hypothetical protein SCLCIDRAFT_1220254 [Scleroderma citrinum Foug A]
MADIEALIGVASGTLGVLFPAFKVVQQMADSYGRIKFARRKCKAVIRRAALVIKEVHDVHRMNLAKSETLTSITELNVKLQDVQIIMSRLAEMPFFKALLRYEDINFEIEEAHRCLTDCMQLFQIQILLSAQAEKDNAAKQDRASLQSLLINLVGNYAKIRRRFSLHSDEDEDLAMAVMERKLRNTNPASQENVEIQIIQKSLECIKVTTGRNVPKQNKWLITEYDLDYCGTIGGGGFSTVSKARFRGMTVAVKTLKDVGNVKEALEREIEIWSGLRHDHIVPFYGASTLASPPYVVSRYMYNGNLVQYLSRKPNVDRIKLVFEVSLGMFYLHREYIVHGDLKGVNVLVDDSGKACITDFGLSKVYSSGTSGTQMGKISGTLRFLAPEALRGHSLTFETDVYAFGMLIYEVFMGEVPFIREHDDKVRKGCLKLCRPTSSKVYERGFNDALWQLLSQCIYREPSARPSFHTIQARLSPMKKAELSSQTLDPAITLITEDEHVTNWVDDAGPKTPSTLVNGITPLVKKSKSASEERPTANSSNPSVTNWKAKSASGEQPTVLVHHRSISLDTENIPSVCIEVTCKYFGVKFGLLSREPGIHLEENNTFQWQPIKPTKGSLSREETNRFTFQSRVSEGRNSWELDGNDVILQSAVVVRGVCRFSDAETAKKWFRLQLGYAKNGSISEWGTSNVTGDWFETVQSWRRFERGKVQKAGLVEGTTSIVPSNNFWVNADLPKRCTMNNISGTVNCIVCTTNPGTAQAGKFCCKLEGDKIIFETYRRQHDGMPIAVREELYPSEEDAETMFQVLKGVLRKVKGKSNILGILSF